MTNDVQTMRIPHLGGSTIGYRFGQPYDASKPTLVMVNSFITSSALYEPQFNDAALAGAANLLAIELYGHGATRTDVEQFTYWDTATANLQVLDALGIASAFVLGTSQGGWICARMAMLAPQTIKGIIPLGTSMDYESPQSQQLGCWNGYDFLTPSIEELARPVADDWQLATEFCDGVLQAGLGDTVSPQQRDFWRATMKKNYAGDAGRRRLRMCAINLRDRDGLYGRLDGVRCPVLWMHGTEDTVYSVANAEAGIAKFTASAQAKLEVVQGGQHFLSASDPGAVNAACVAFLQAWNT
ncbi:MAG: alpha/beta hydrolase [Rhodoferax sp.]|nr:alpha/beta hydrolase [Rhodoferax sp.]MCB2029802.1 alpha/beta hydrolase [Rhodoferax sp.]MCB2042875.1 alpha/beta hydrolase [Rhodoferax sp.]